MKCVVFSQKDKLNQRPDFELSSQSDYPNYLLGRSLYVGLRSNKRPCSVRAWKTRPKALHGKIST